MSHPSLLHHTINVLQDERDSEEALYSAVTRQEQKITKVLYSFVSRNDTMCPKTNGHWLTIRLISSANTSMDYGIDILLQRSGYLTRVENWMLRSCLNLGMRGNTLNGTEFTKWLKELAKAFKLQSDQIGVTKSDQVRLIQLRPHSELNDGTIQFAIDEQFANISVACSHGHYVFHVFHRVVNNSYSMLQMRALRHVLDIAENGGDLSNEEFNARVETLRSKFKLVYKQAPSPFSFKIYVFPSELPHMVEENILVRRYLSKGKQAQVFEGRFVSGWESRPIALKIFNDRSEWSKFEEEYNLLRDIPPHPNVVEVQGMVPKSRCVKLGLISGENLRHRLNRNDLPQAMRPTVLLGIAQGLYHIHQSNIFHRDVKSENIMIEDGTYRPVLVDFGFGRMDAEAFVNSIRTQTWRGTPCWVAPEMFAECRWGITTDVYAFGIVMWEVLTSMEPYANKNFDLFQLINHVQTGGRPDSHLIPEEFSRYIKLMESCWHQSSAERPRMDRVLNELHLLS